MSEFARALVDRRVVVLGATGFIGRWVAREASRAGARVWLVARDEAAAADVASRYGIRGAVARVDVLQAGDLAAFYRDVRPELTCNLIGYGVDRRETDPALAEAINVDLVRRLLELVPDAAAGSDWPGLHLVHTGSALEYGAIGGHLAEDAVVNPTTVYGQTKLAATRLVEAAVADGILRAVTARLFTVYGPGEHEGRLLPSILSARSSTTAVPMTNGLQQRDFTFVGDVAEGLLRAAVQPAVPWTTVNLATGQLHTVREFVTRAEAALGLTPGRFQFGALPTRAEEMAHAAVTVERARTWLGWVPATGIAEGVAATDAFLASIPTGRRPLTGNMALDLLTRNTMRFSLSALTTSSDALEAAARHYEEHGFFMVEGVGDAVTRHYKPLVADRLQVSPADLDGILDPNSPPMILPVETRQRMSRIDTTPELAAALLTNLEPVLLRLLGGLLHVSSNFHGQFKGGEVKPVDHGGYDPNAQYLEVQGQYLIHQDFSGAALPTSPCGVTLWTPLNSCPDWNLRIYPGTHRFGLLCHEWMKLEDPRLAAFGITPVDVVAEAGTCVIFNSLLLHSSSNPGPRRRVSCDLRFFPLTGFLPSQVRLLGPDPLATLRAGLAREDGPTLKAPHLEAAAFLGLVTEPTPCPPYSILNWANYLAVLLNGSPEAALPHMERFVNLAQGIDSGVDIYAKKFHNREVHRTTLANLLAALQARTPSAPEVQVLARRLAA